MDYIDVKYVGLVSMRVSRFKQTDTSPYKANFRCPICGDSAKKTSKKRGWIYEKNNSVFFHCFNCNASLTLRNFLKTIDINLYNEYVVDKKLEVAKTFESLEPVKPLDTLTQKVPEYRKGDSPLLKLKKVSQLPPNHSVKKYVLDRQIPHNKHYLLYYADDFNTWVNSFIPNKMADKKSRRLVLPFLDNKGNLFGFAGRALDNSEELRYISIMLDESMPKIFGLDRIDFDKRYYLVEGPIDSLFISNAIAMAGTSSQNDILKNKNNLVYVYDNEPRNKEVIKMMEKAINEGNQICIWPETIKSKDINDMILSGLTPGDVKLIIDQHTYSGLRATLQLSYWRKC